MKILTNFNRHDIVKLLKGDMNYGVELGVAKGIFSKRMIDSKRFSLFIGIDMYGGDRRHDTSEYKHALISCGLNSNYKLLRMRFDEALDLFEDQSLDFIYVDGYAHTGEEDGKTIFDWYPKLKVGGVMAGDDYHDDWPLVKIAVNNFVEQISGELLLTDKVEEIDFCRYPTWAIIKK